MEKQKKICAITTIQKTMVWFVTDSMRNLAANGYDVTLVCNMDEDFVEKNSDYAKCISFDMKRGASLSDIFTYTKRFFELFKKEKYDVIYYLTPNAAFYASMAGLLAGVKKRVYSQCGLRYVSFTGAKRFVFKTIEKLTCMFSTHIRAQSPLNRQFAIDEGLCRAEKISVVGIGGTTGVLLRECDSFDKNEVRKQLREKYGVPQDAFVYGYVGRVNADKGINELIDAFSQVKTKVNNAYLVLVGMIDDTNPIDAERYKQAQADDRIIFTGNVSPDIVYQHMSMFDILTHPTYREGFGKVLQEAMGMSLPIITTDVPGPKEVVENGVSGILVEVMNSEALSEKMVELANDKEKRENLAKNGRERAEKYFDRPIMLNNTLLDMNSIMEE